MTCQYGLQNWNSFKLLTCQIHFFRLNMAEKYKSIGLAKGTKILLFLLAKVKSLNQVTSIEEIKIVYWLTKETLQPKSKVFYSSSNFE